MPNPGTCPCAETPVRRFPCSLGLPAWARIRIHPFACLPIFLFLLALTPRLLYLASIPQAAVQESVDAQGYDQLARNLRAGYGFSLHDASPPSISSGQRYQPDGLRTPLYPLFVAATYAVFGERPVVVAAVQAILDSITALIVGAIVRKLIGRGAGIAAVALYALTPVQWRYAAALLPEVPLALLIALVVWLLVRFSQSENSRVLTTSEFCPARWVIACGAMAGLVALCKPNVAGMALIVAGAALWSLRVDRRRAVLSAAAITLTAAAVASPWIIRNWLVFGRPFLSNAGLGFVARVTAPATLGFVEDHRVPPWSPEWEARYHAIVTQAATRHGWSLEQSAPLLPPEADQRERHIAQTAQGIVLAHPWEALRAHLIGFARSWAPLEQTFWYTHLSGRSWEGTGVAANSYRDAVEILFAGRPTEAFEFAFIKPWDRLDPLGRILWCGWGLGHLLGITLTALGVWRLHYRPALALATAATILYATLPPGPIGYVRFRVPVMSLITVLEVAGLVWLGSKFQPLPVKLARGILATPEQETQYDA